MIQLFNIPKHIIDTGQFKNVLHDPIRTTYESNIAKYVGAKYAVAVTSCTDAIFLALKFIGEKVTCTIPSLSTTRFLNAIIHSGNDYIITDNVTWVGHNYILYDDKFKIIDSAQEVEPNMFIEQCNDDDILLLSNYPTKPVGGLKGGVVISNDKDKIEWIRQAAYFGEIFSKDSWNGQSTFVGWQMYMNSIEAYMANENLHTYKNKREKLNNLSRVYVQELNKEIITCKSKHLFRIRVDDNIKFIEYMKNNGIVCGIHYKPVHLNEVYNYNRKWECTASEFDGTTVASIPFHEELTQEETDRVIKIINAYPCM
jgi:dTDP-4-amino-4,6-dideoxygalactose transaminase